MIRLLTLSLLSALLFTACSDDDNTTSPPPPQSVSGVYIVNEGNFQRGNASLSYFIPDSNRVYNDIFKSVNGKDLGDTGNSITIHDGKAYIVVNGSDKIEVIDVKTHKLVKTISSPAGSSPRHIVFAANGTGYISNLFANSVSVYNDATNTITVSIPVGDNPEEMLAANGHLFVMNSGFGNGRTISVINTSSNVLVKTISVSDGPTSIAATSSTSAVALCAGAYNDFQDPNDDTPGKLFFLNTSTLTVTDSLELGGHPQRLALDDSGNLFTIQSGAIQKIHLASKTRTDSFISGSFYHIAFDGEKKKLYATSPLDYVQPGKLEVYEPTGAMNASYTVGIIPGAMGFVK